METLFFGLLILALAMTFSCSVMICYLTKEIKDGNERMIKMVEGLRGDK